MGVFRPDTYDLIGFSISDQEVGPRRGQLYAAWHVDGCGGEGAWRQRQSAATVGATGPTEAAGIAPSKPAVREVRAPEAKTLFVPVSLPAPAAPAPLGDIRIELKRGATAVTVTWLASAASECAAWMLTVRLRSPDLNQRPSKNAGLFSCCPPTLLLLGAYAAQTANGCPLPNLSGTNLQNAPDS